MLHPDLDDLIRHIRARRMMAGLITNGYFLVPKRIEELNRAGLDFLQISIDNVEPDEVSKKVCGFSTGSCSTSRNTPTST